MMANRCFRAGLMLILLATLGGCATLTPLEEPSIKLDSLRLLPSQGINQRFQLGLLISNPNSRALPLAGISYTVSLNGFDVISGVSADLPALGAYSETPVTLEASADLVSAMRLLNSLATKPRDSLDYELSAKIDLQGMRPSFTVSRDGLIELRQPR